MNFDVIARIKTMLHLHVINSCIFYIYMYVLYLYAYHTHENSISRNQSNFLSFDRCDLSTPTSQESEPVPNVDLLGDFANRMYRAHGLESPAPRTARARLKVWWDVGGVKNGWF
jgi:hypothetical protein